MRAVKIQQIMNLQNECCTNPETQSEGRQDLFFERLVVRAATIDELLSDNFEALPGQKCDTDAATRRLAAWCRSCASGDWKLFARRLERDRLSIDQVLARFATIRRNASAAMPLWLDDARWVDAAFRNQIPDTSASSALGEIKPCAFEHLFMPVIEQAEKRLWARISDRAIGNLAKPARSCLGRTLLGQLSDLCAPALYDCFVAAMKAGVKSTKTPNPQQGVGTSHYDRFVAEMRSVGFRRLFEEKPVLLRLIASVTRQWIDSTRELVMRLDADLPVIRRDILCCIADSQVANIEGGLSDPHNFGRSVQIVTFNDGRRVVYKPKDIRLDARWHALIERLNYASPPIDLKAVRILSREGYGWTEFIDHTECAESQDFERFFLRAGAWLALFHAFAGTDMHDENMIAAGDHPMPIDLEMILQASSPEEETKDPRKQAFVLATDKIANSVAMVGLLPAYGRSPSNKVFGVGGLDGEHNSILKRGWETINTDGMRPFQSTEVGKSIPNLPHVNGKYAHLGDHVDNMITGFSGYATFLLDQRKNLALFEGFADLPVRKVLRPTRFYYMLLQRLKDHRTMEDGVAWSAQIDFIARLADWDSDIDPIWPLQRAENAALVELNVPYFTSPSDGNDISNGTGISTHTVATPGIDRARARLECLDEQEIAWQVEVIRQSTNTVASSAGRATVGWAAERVLHSDEVVTPEPFIAEANKIVEELSNVAIRSGPGAAWIGLDWLGDSDLCQLVPLGSDLYNGTSGIAVFLAAHARLTGHQAAKSLALAALSSLRQNLKGPSAARMARSIGIGGASGLGSIVYALTVLSSFMDDDELLTEAHSATQLFSDDLIAADKTLDIIGGSAGAILGLLRLYRATEARDVLERATRCGEHLLSQRRIGPKGRRSWSGQGVGPQVLNGMSHGAAGFAYSLASLSAITGRDDFAAAALECISFENASYDAARGNWPDFRFGTEASWSSQWCHGAVGIGLARAATLKRGGLNTKAMLADVQKALGGIEKSWPNGTDTLCCGTLGSIEFLCEASSALGRSDLSDLASRRLMAVLNSAKSNGDYRWHVGDRRFNLGLFRGLAGVGYTLLRRVDVSLPNVTTWE